MALGHGDPNAPINRWYSSREAVDGFAVFAGFPDAAVPHSRAAAAVAAGGEAVATLTPAQFRACRSHYSLIEIVARRAFPKFESYQAAVSSL